MKPRVWIDSVPHGERRPRSFIASDLYRRHFPDRTRHQRARRPPGARRPWEASARPELHLRLLAGKAQLHVPGSARGSMCVPPYASEASSRPRQMRGQAGRGVGGDRRSNGPGRSACIRGRGIPARNCSAMLAGLRGFCSSSRLEHHASARCGQSRGAVLAHPVPPLGAAPRSHVARVGVSRCAPTRRRGRPPASGQKRSWQIR